MSNWVRLWEDMPNDPKWRVIARRAKRPISEVLAVFVHMMTNAGQAAIRGSLEGWNDEDVGAALDMEPSDVAAIREAMQGKTLDGDRLIGWEYIRSTERGDGRLPASQWMPLRAEVFARDDFTCQYCGERGGKLECDHIFPVSKGGSHDLSNLATACFDCNRSKRNKTISEWRGRQ